MTNSDRTICFKALSRAIITSEHPPPPGEERFKPASVMALMSFKRTPNLILIQKTDNEGYPWRNQMAFPGGHWDPGDKTRQDTALRELGEEMGIPKHHVFTIGSLGHFQTINNWDIEAFIGVWDQERKILFDPVEIQRVFHIPLAHLLKVHMERGFPGRMPGLEELTYPFEDIVIWGVTAKIIHHFMEIIRQKVTPACSD
ncbi:MAG: CoA pyrophosphatase [Desulfobacterium sp.]|nr:CoA pyrophosphatase [Desulfobacterium sp.]